MKNTEIVKIDENSLVLIDGVQYSLNELKAFIETSQELSEKVNRQSRFIESLKLHNKDLTVERNKLCEKCMEQSKELQNIKKMSMFEFGNTYCTSESLEADGHAFARALGVGQ